MIREDGSISRKEVLQMIDNIREAGGFIGFNTYSEAFDQVNNMSSVPRWIPVSESLPEKINAYYLVTVKISDITEIDIAYRLTDSWQAFRDCEVLAWMPLPKPYKAKSEEV